MTDEAWARAGKRFPRYHTGELKATRIQNQLLSKLDNFPMKRILQDMQSKKSFHIHDWNITDREIVTNLRALPAPAPALP